MFYHIYIWVVVQVGGSFVPLKPSQPRLFSVNTLKNVKFRKTCRCAARRGRICSISTVSVPSACAGLTMSMPWFRRFILRGFRPEILPKPWRRSQVKDRAVCRPLILSDSRPVGKLTTRPAASGSEPKSLHPWLVHGCYFRSGLTKKRTFVPVLIGTILNRNHLIFCHWRILPFWCPQVRPRQRRHIIS